jgi:hypothetical protein
MSSSWTPPYPIPPEPIREAGITPEPLEEPADAPAEDAQDEPEN